MAVKLPDVVYIFGSEVRVIKKDGIVHGNTLCSGLYDMEQKVIYIDKTLSKKDSMAALIHEMGHAMFDRCGLNQTDIGLNLQEIIVENMALMMVESFSLTVKQ